MKTLIVKYLPKGENSSTKKLLDFFLDEINDEIEVLDLLQNPAPLHDENSIGAYLKRNYAGKTLTDEESGYLKEQDKLKNQLLTCDIVIMAYPMHNFSMPAAVKAYMDAVIMNGETFEPGKKLMAGKKALTLYSSGGEYSEKVGENYPDWDTLSALAKINFGFMGFDEAKIVKFATNNEEKAQKGLKEAKKEIENIVKEWYK